MKNAEIIEMTSEDLNDKIQEIESVLNKMRMDHTVSELENPMSIQHSRRFLARLKTEKQKRQIQLK
jgi:large subunit ribosomal protein L29